MKVQRTITLAIALALVVFGAVACSKNSSPTKAVQTFYDAMKNKDVKALKSVMPKEVLDAGEANAKKQNKTFDDLLKEAFDKGALPKVPDKLETQNETIAGDGKTATIEAKDENGKWQTLHLAKEDDGWKLKDF